jgi:hypothetical protein
MNFLFLLHSNCPQGNAVAPSMFPATHNQLLAGIQMPVLFLFLLLLHPLPADLPMLTSCRLAI